MTPPDQPPAPPPEPNLPLIRASELAQYAYCHRAWWLGTVRKLTPRNRSARRRGIHAHQRHAELVQTARRWRLISLLLLGSGLILGMILAGWWWWF